ncbi:MAG: glycosyltransferase [Solirubrobacteraceae bacterium]|jgi:glycosyltransferase involved in cell wall biosynthesis
MAARIAILRGEALNPFELQSYAPLRDSYELVAIGARGGAYDLTGLQVPLASLPPVGSGRLARRLLGDRSARLRGLAAALSGCELVHSAETFLPISEQAAELKPAHGFKLVLTCWENIPFLHDDNPLLSARKRLVREATDLFVAVTQGARDALLLEGVAPDRIVVQPVGVDRATFHEQAADATLRGGWELADGSQTVLYCGRLIREKGVLDLLRALASVPQTALIIVGQGPERARLELAASACGLADRVRFIGSAAYGELPRFYASVDAFCLPSVPTPYWQEQFGMVLVEAMACGRPVVTTASGSIPEVVGEAAVVVPPYSPDALAAALSDLLADRGRQAALAASGLARVAERYDATRVSAALGDIYARLLR